MGAVSQFGVGVLLARLLTPADFGLMSLALIVLGFLRPLGDLGIGRALVQRSNLSGSHVRIAFTFSILLGMALTLLVFLGAPLGGLIMRDPRVTQVLRVLAFGFLLQSIGVVAGALLQRQLDFKPQFFIDSCTYLFGYALVAATLALRGWGVWSLVYGGLIQSLLASIVQLLAVRHPIRPLWTYLELRELLDFGVGASGSLCINYIALNADNFIVGRWLGVSSLGLYSRAYNLMNLPFSYAAVIISTVLFSAFARVQGERERFQRAYLLMTQLMAMIAGPSMAILAVVAPHLVRALYGPKWVGVAIPLQILCAAGYFRALYHLGGVIAQSAGLVYSELRLQVIYAVMVICGSCTGARFGLPGVAVGVSAAILFMFVAMARLALRATGGSWVQYLRVQIPAIFTAVMALVVAIGLRLLLEFRQSSYFVIAITVSAGAGLPWLLGVLWSLSRPKFQPLRDHLLGQSPWPFKTLARSSAVS